MFSPIMPALKERARRWGLQLRPAGDKTEPMPQMRVVNLSAAHRMVVPDRIAPQTSP